MIKDSIKVGDLLLSNRGSILLLVTSTTMVDDTITTRVLNHPQPRYIGFNRYCVSTQLLDTNYTLLESK